MAIKATFPAGQDIVSVSGLFQWDYGQSLEIEIADIGSEIAEVHFACSNMSEAIVRPCSFSNGVGTVTIPDQCLEQTTDITAWIYRIVGNSGHTIKTITLPITARTRPSMVQEIPQEFSDKYTELVTEINEAVENLESGNITVAKAENALTANHAATAGNANSASNATYAARANLATTVALVIHNSDTTYGTTIADPGLYLVAWLNEGDRKSYSALLYVPDWDKDAYAFAGENTISYDASIQTISVEYATVSPRDITVFLIGSV